MIVCSSITSVRCAKSRVASVRRGATGHVRLAVSGLPVSGESVVRALTREILFLVPHVTSIHTDSSPARYSLIATCLIPRIFQGEDILAHSRNIYCYVITICYTCIDSRIPHFSRRKNEESLFRFVRDGFE